MTEIEQLIKRRSNWSQCLTAIAEKPLEFCPHMNDLAELWEDWWRMENRRPLFIGTLPRQQGAMIRRDKLLDLLDKPEEWLKIREQQLKETLWSVDTVPQYRVDIGPVAVAAFLGTPLELLVKENTGWQTPWLDSLGKALDLRMNPDNFWLEKVLRLTKLAACQARGRHAICTPDLSGPIDILSNMRGPENLCFDLLENADLLKHCAKHLVEVWAGIYRGIIINSKDENPFRRTF